MPRLCILSTKAFYDGKTCRDAHTKRPHWQRTIGSLARPSAHCFLIFRIVHAFFGQLSGQITYSICNPSIPFSIHPTFTHTHPYYLVIQSALHPLLHNPPAPTLREQLWRGNTGGHRTLRASSPADNFAQWWTGEVVRVKCTTISPSKPLFQRVVLHRWEGDLYGFDIKLNF